MPKRRQTPDRPRDVMQLAKRIGEIATGQVKDVPEPVNEAARRRGEARAKALTKKERSEIAEKAAAARWKRKAE